MDVSLAWLELDMRTVLGSRAIGARGCRRRGGTITARPPPGVATRGMEWPDRVVIGPDCCRSRGFRSEEHTSELQSLMRTSYAAFCLNKITAITDTTKFTETSHA